MLNSKNGKSCKVECIQYERFCEYFYSKQNFIESFAWRVEVCTILGRKISDEFFNGPCRQLKSDFFNGSGRANRWEVIFPTGPAGLIKRKYVCQQPGQAKRKNKKKGRRIILRVSPGRQNKDEILKPADKSLIMNFFSWQ